MHKVKQTQGKICNDHFNNPYKFTICVLFCFFYFKMKPWSHTMLPRLVFNSWAQKTLAGEH